MKDSCTPSKKEIEKMTKVAVVSGSNKGIGFAIVRGLCKSFDGDVYLTSRNEERGNEAVEQLKKEGLNPKFHQLDINDQGSVERLRDFLQENYGGLDVLVNNAAIAYKGADPAPFAEQAEVTMKTNFTNLLMVCDVLFPILRNGARVCHMSSFASFMILGMLSAELQAEFKSTSSRQHVEDLMARFVSAAKAGTHKEQGWSQQAYATTKLGVTAITPIQQAMFDKDPREDIIVNATCPGWVATDMAGPGSWKKTPDAGAENPLYLSLLKPGAKSPHGQLVMHSKAVVNWKASGLYFKLLYVYNFAVLLYTILVLYFRHLLGV